LHGGDAPLKQATLLVGGGHPCTLVHDRVRDDRRLFISSRPPPSWITSDLYTRNLVSSSGMTARSSTGWRQLGKQLQHGAALKRYVRPPGQFRLKPLPELRRRILPNLHPRQLAGTRALEMAARCVVETGRHLLPHAVGTEPQAVLKQLAAGSAPTSPALQAFLPLFLRYRRLEQPGRAAITARSQSGHRGRDRGRLLCLQSRLPRRDPDTGFRKRDAAYRDSIVQLAKHHFPHENGDQDAAEAA
jgi:hypothetical protein